jgi:predicted dehydrogenase
MLTRRTLLSTGLAAGATLSLDPRALARPTRRQASDELRVAVVGVRSRGRDHIEGLRRQPGVRLVALCDVDQEFLDREAKRLAGLEEPVEVDRVRDYRRLLERDDIDAVSIATPNHWHSLQAVWACQAGKHVYVEKPVSHNVWEGRQAVKAARKYKRIVAAGTQCRSSQAIAEAIAWVQAGNLGRIRLARGLCYKPRPSIGKVDGPQEPPATVDYDLWTGPAMLKPLMRSRLHYDWHWVTDTGNGDLGNQGIHQMDIARWALGETGPAPAVLSIGGRLGYDDDGNTPNTQIALHLYERAPLLFEVRGLPRDVEAQQGNWGQGMDDFMGARIGVIVHCEKGTLRVPTYNAAQAYDLEGNQIQSWQGARDHYANFVAAVRSGRHEDLTADIEEGHQSSALCHYGNISHALGEPASVAELRKAAEPHEPMAEALGRMVAHLEANGVDLEETPLTLGREMRIDLASETFRDDYGANPLLTREYREPFVVPAI